MDNIWMILSAVGSFMALATLSLITFRRYRTELALVSDELRFFKKEREYYEEAMLMLSNEGRIVFSNQAAKNLFSLNENNIMIDKDTKIELRLHKNKEPEEFFNLITQIQRENLDSFKLQHKEIIINGEANPVNIFIDKSGWFNQDTFTCVIDMGSSHQVENQKGQEKEGSIDFLTGLPSQFLAMSDINTLVVQAQKKSEPFAIFLMGVDHFEDIQTTLGLTYTNRVLKKLGDYFKDKQDDFIRIYKMESDKFIFVIKNIREDEEIRKKARDFITSIGSIYQDSNEIRLTASIGVVGYPKDGTNAIKLIDSVYSTLKRGQKKGDANISFFDNDYKEVALDEIKMNEEIKKGIKRNQFLLYYQPIFDIVGEKMVGAEALLRWEHPDHGLISANQFLEIAEKTGLIVDLGAYVFEEAIKQREEWNDKVAKNFKITINLSLREMQVEALLKKLDTLFDKYNVTRNMINLDISETLAMENIDKTTSNFKLLSDFGLSLSMDNVGAGYSSFKYIGMLPLSMIKIDRSLIFDLALNKEHQKTVKGMIDFMHTLGYKVAAEGVETLQEVAILNTLSCDYVQGYLYSKPVPSGEFEKLLT